MPLLIVLRLTRAESASRSLTSRLGGCRDPWHRTADRAAIMWRWGRRQCANLESLGLALALALSIGCGKSEEQKAAEKAAEETQEGRRGDEEGRGEDGRSRQPTKGLSGRCQGARRHCRRDGRRRARTASRSSRSASRAADGASRGAGWERDEADRRAHDEPVAFSQAEATTRRATREVEVKIVDSAFSQMLVAPWSMFLPPATRSRRATATRSRSTSAAIPASRSGTAGSKDGELNLVVAKRFLVTIEGNNIDDTKVLQEFASKIDAASSLVEMSLRVASQVDSQPYRPRPVSSSELYSRKPAFSGSSPSIRNVCSPVIQAEPWISGTIAGVSPTWRRPDDPPGEQRADDALVHEGRVLAKHAHLAEHRHHRRGAGAARRAIDFGVGEDRDVAQVRVGMLRAAP